MPTDRSTVHDSDVAVTFVNRFALRCTPAAFEEAFAATSRFMAAQPGFRAHTLLRATEGDAHYINIAHWDDDAAFRAAVAHPTFAEHASALRALATSEPRLYRSRLHQTPTLETGDPQ